MRPARANKRDANEAEIVAALEKIGATVHTLDQPVDLVVGYQARNYLFEVKDGNKPPSKRQKTDNQKRFFAAWKGQVRIVETPEDAIRAVTRAYRHAS